MALSIEYKLLAYCAQAEINDKKNIKLKELLNKNLDWPYILEESIGQGIPCLLYHNLSQFAQKIPHDIRNKLKEIYYINTYRNIDAYQEMNVIFSSFNKKNIKFIPLKGVFLAEKVYNNIALRPMADIDILVKKEELPKVDKLLNSSGYSTSIRKELLRRAIKKAYLNSVDYFKNDRKSPTLHIHWHIVNVSLPTYMYTANIRMKKFWEAAMPAKIAGTKTLQLAPRHLIICLAEHALKHSFDKLLLLSDIDAVIKKYNERMDWENLIKDTVEFNMQRQVFYGLYFTGYFLGARIPNYVLPKLKPQKTGLLERRFFYSVAGNNRKAKLCYFVYLNMVNGILKKSKFIFRTLFPPPPVIALALNLNKSKVTIKDYILFLQKKILRLKECLSFFSGNR